MAQGLHTTRCTDRKRGATFCENHKDLKNEQRAMRHNEINPRPDCAELTAEVVPSTSDMLKNIESQHLADLSHAPNFSK